MPGIKAFRKIQMGREVSAGTAVAATAVWRGTGTPEDSRELTWVPEDIGIAVPADRGYFGSLGALFPFDETPATFEQLIHIGEAGIKTIGTGAADGAGSGKIYNFSTPTTTANTIKTYTLEGGDDAGAEEMEYCFVQDFTLKGEPGQALMLQANWLGRQLAPTTFTGALTAPTVEDILFSKGKLYIEAIGGTYGATQKSNTLIGMNLNWKTGWVPSDPGDGNLYFMFHKYTPTNFLAELGITFEHETTSIAEKVNWRAQTPRKIQLKFEGTALTSAGTAYTYKTLLINLAGKWRKFDKIDERNGNDIINATFEARYNATAASAGGIIVVNEVATVP